MGKARPGGNAGAVTCRWCLAAGRAQGQSVERGQEGTELGPHHLSQAMTRESGGEHGPGARGRPENWEQRARGLAAGWSLGGLSQSVQTVGRQKPYHS